MMDNILPLATANGLIPDSVVNSSEVSAGRPLPWMITVTVRIECVSIESDGKNR